MINLFTSVKQAQGDTVRPLLLNILGVSINLILDPLFLVIFNWGIGGAALATLLAKIPSAIIGVLVLLSLIHIWLIRIKPRLTEHLYLRLCIQEAVRTIKDLYR